ncbi:esterase-like activity of phytase family protein [Bdellovibrio bacteriovorus]|uniref:esterase-like activity of phytase family protein n=1 Tax=Bdellovibrio bacteriovorus TaxID=959 RepID=UPI0035A70279
MLKACGIFFSLLLGFQAQALHLEYVGETSIKNAEKFKKTTIGGLSGIVWSGTSLYAVSDDRGRFGEPRFYEFELSIDKKSVTLKPKDVKFIKNLPKYEGKEDALDAEGLALLPSGDFVISSEGNNNAKPRQMPRLFRVSKDGKWKNDLPLPDKFLPELTGQQKKGTQNNVAFEGLTSFADGKFLYAATESPLLQESSFVDKSSAGAWIRIIKFEDKGSEGYKVAAEYAYNLDAVSSTDKGHEVFRGVSEILALSENKLIVMERGVRVSPKNLLAKTTKLYLADLTSGTDVSKLAQLGEGPFKGASKTALIDFETDLTKSRPGKSVENFEAMAWGPKLADGRRSLLVMVDDNFSKKEVTELLVFAVEGE